MILYKYHRGKDILLRHSHNFLEQYDVAQSYTLGHESAFVEYSGDLDDFVMVDTDFAKRYVSRKRCLRAVGDFMTTCKSARFYYTEQDFCRHASFSNLLIKESEKFYEVRIAKDDTITKEAAECDWKVAPVAISDFHGNFVSKDFECCEISRIVFENHLYSKLFRFDLLVRSKEFRFQVLLGLKEMSMWTNASCDCLFLRDSDKCRYSCGWSGHPSDKHGEGFFCGAPLSAKSITEWMAGEYNNLHRITTKDELVRVIQALVAEDERYWRDEAKLERIQNRFDDEDEDYSDEIGPSCNWPDYD